MIKARLDCKVIIRNVPESIINGKRQGYIVARVDRGVMWYYGCYETDVRAATVADELGNGAVLNNITEVEG